MLRLRLVLLAMTAVWLAHGQGPPAHCRARTVELRGTIEKIQIVPGAGMPFLEIRTGEGREKVMLGSLRYLMEQSFDPHAGDEVVIQGVRDSATVLAVRIEIPSRKIKLQLREPHTCMPMWRRMGRRGRQ